MLLLQIFEKVKSFISIGNKSCETDFGSVRVIFFNKRTENKK